MPIDYWAELEKAVAAKDAVAVISLANQLRLRLPPPGIPVRPPAPKERLI